LRPALPKRPATRAPAKPAPPAKKPAKKPAKTAAIPTIPAAAKPSPGTEIDDVMVGMGVADIANTLGYNRRTVGEWIKEGCPRGPIRAILEWISRNGRGGPAGPENRLGALGLGGRTEELNPDGTRKRTLTERRTLGQIRAQVVDTELRMLNLAEKRQDLVSKRRVKRDVATIFVRLKERLIAAPDRFEPKFPAEVRVECKQDLEDFCRLLLVELRQMPVGGQDVDELILLAAEDIQASRRRDVLASDAASDSQGVE
jgi:hypothetical protein